jgi:hypothetical protein
MRFREQCVPIGRGASGTVSFSSSSPLEEEEEEEEEEEDEEDAVVVLVGVPWLAVPLV